MSAATKLENPHERRAPSARDRDIYLLHKAHRVKQKDLAVKFGMKPPRVSQIVKKVGEWFANASAKDGELDHNQQRRLERRIERERLEHLYDYNLRMLADFEKPAESTRGAGEDAVTTKREERSARVQALKTAVRTAESLGKIAEREPLPEPSQPGMNGFVRLDLLLEELIRRRTAAEERGKAPASGDVYYVVWFLMRMLEGDPVKPIAAGSPLQAAMGKIVATLVEAGAVAGEGSRVGGQESEGGCVVAATTQLVAGENAGDPLCYAAAAKHSHPGNNHSGDPTGAKVTKLPGYAMLDGCDPGVLETIVASGWLERFKDDGPLAREAAIAASLARENSGDFSADGSEVQSPRSKVAEGGCVVAATTQSVAGQKADDPLCYAAAAKHSHPAPPPAPSPPAPLPRGERGENVVGSPEWQVARGKWLKERDERVAAERLQKIRERIDRDEDLRQRRAAAAARNRWLEAGQCQY